MFRWWKRMLAKLPGAQRWDLTSLDKNLLRRRRPDGEVEYREMTAEEAEHYDAYQAIR